MSECVYDKYMLGCVFVSHICMYSCYIMIIEYYVFCMLYYSCTYCTIIVKLLTYKIKKKNQYRYTILNKLIINIQKGNMEASQQDGSSILPH